jgi:hypothetical protein
MEARGMHLGEKNKIYPQTEDESYLMKKFDFVPPFPQFLPQVRGNYFFSPPPQFLSQDKIMIVVPITKFYFMLHLLIFYLLQA